MPNFFFFGEKERWLEEEVKKIYMPQIAFWATLRCLLPATKCHKDQASFHATKTKSKGQEKKRQKEKQSERDKDSVLATTNVSPYQRSIIKSVATRLPACACYCCSLHLTFSATNKAPISDRVIVDSTRGLSASKFCGCVVAKMLISVLRVPCGKWQLVTTV